ncbi:hypothetical protein EON62_03935 [archaeon]|nr:MAG: hypothetical protein EON62_03935 [archaeon]
MGNKRRAPGSGSNAAPSAPDPPGAGRTSATSLLAAATSLPPASAARGMDRSRSTRRRKTLSVDAYHVDAMHDAQDTAFVDASGLNVSSEHAAAMAHYNDALLAGSSVYHDTVPDDSTEGGVRDSRSASVASASMPSSARAEDGELGADHDNDCDDTAAVHDGDADDVEAGGDEDEEVAEDEEYLIDDAEAHDPSAGDDELAHATDDMLFSGHHADFHESIGMSASDHGFTHSGAAALHYGRSRAMSMPAPEGEDAPFAPQHHALGGVASSEFSMGAGGHHAAHHHHHHSDSLLPGHMFGR